jgi:predicted metal-dependent hydrolase
VERLLIMDSAVRREVSARARRISLKVDVAAGEIVLVRPRRCSDHTVEAFLTEKRAWIARQRSRLPLRLKLADGIELPLLGERCMVRAAPTAKRGVWRDGDVIHVSGAAEHLARRLKDYLKAEARGTFSGWARSYASLLNVKVSRVSVRDTVSRWGSCTRDGRLSLSWRLMFAPRAVAAYVVAHEVAHLKHMNHSAAFWRTVDRLAPDMTTSRAWLRRHGAELHRYS